MTPTDGTGMGTIGRKRSRGRLSAALATFAIAFATAAAPRAAESTAPDLTVAFIADQGLGPDSRAVLELIRNEGTDAVIHQGDLDYEDAPAAWIAQINDVLGPDFPYFASIGNHDTDFWFARGGYNDVLTERLKRQGIEWEGILGIRSTLYYQGLFIMMTAPGIYTPLGVFFDDYIQDQLAEDDSIWRVSSWHKNQTRMQVGNKANATGWRAYEEARRGGAITATGHEHSYSRTHLLRDVSRQTVASTDNTLQLTEDDPRTPADEGRSFVFVSGLGGRSVRDQERGGSWWASIYTLDQGAAPGALFGVFHYQGDPRLAYFYFKDINGVIADEFFVRSRLGIDDWDEDGIPGDGDGSGVAGDSPCTGGETERCDDNCRYAPNADQGDVGGIGGATPDGVGDACQCGDVDADGRVDGSDFTAFVHWLIGRRTPGTFQLDRCNLNAGESCNWIDLFRLRSAIRSDEPPDQFCAAAQP